MIETGSVAAMRTPKRSAGVHPPAGEEAHPDRGEARGEKHPERCQHADDEQVAAELLPGEGKRRLEDEWGEKGLEDELR